MNRKGKRITYKAKAGEFIGDNYEARRKKNNQKVIVPLMKQFV